MAEIGNTSANSANPTVVVQSSILGIPGQSAYQLWLADGNIGDYDAYLLANKGSKGDPGPAGPGVPQGGQPGQVLTKTNSADYSTAWTDSANGGGSSTKLVDQTAHGFSVGQIVSFKTKYVLSRSNLAANANVVGIVSSVLSVDRFQITTEGYIESLTGLVPGTVYFLSDTESGALTDTAPTEEGTVIKPLFTATSVNSGYFHNYLGIISGSDILGGGTGGGPTTLNQRLVTMNTTLTENDDILIVTAPGLTIDLPDSTSVPVKTYSVVSNIFPDYVRVTAASGQSIMGTPSILNYYQSISLVPNDSGWFIL